MDFKVNYPDLVVVPSIRVGLLQQGEVYRAGNGDFWMVCKNIQSPIDQVHVVGVSPNNLGFLMSIGSGMEILSHFIATKIKIELEMP